MGITRSWNKETVGMGRSEGISEDKVKTGFELGLGERVMQTSRLCGGAWKQADKASEG